MCAATLTNPQCYRAFSNYSCNPLRLVVLAKDKKKPILCSVCFFFFIPPLHALPCLSLACRALLRCHCRVRLRCIVWSRSMPGHLFPASPPANRGFAYLSYPHPPHPHPTPPGFTLSPLSSFCRVPCVPLSPSLSPSVVLSLLAPSSHLLLSSSLSGLYPFLPHSLLLHPHAPFPLWPPPIPLCSHLFSPCCPSLPRLPCPLVSAPARIVLRALSPAPYVSLRTYPPSSPTLAPSTLPAVLFVLPVRGPHNSMMPNRMPLAVFPCPLTGLMYIVRSLGGLHPITQASYLPSLMVCIFNFFCCCRAVSHTP